MHWPIYTMTVEGLLSTVIWNQPIYFLMMTWMLIWETLALQVLSSIPDQYQLDIQVVVVHLLLEEQ